MLQTLELTAMLSILLLLMLAVSILVLLSALNYQNVLLPKTR